MAKDKTRKYGGYLVKDKGVLVALVQLPLGNGKYKKKRTTIPPEVKNKAQWAEQWAVNQKDKHRTGAEPANPELPTASKPGNMTFSALADWYTENYLIAPIYDKQGKKVAGLRGWKVYRGWLENLVKKFGIYRLDLMTVDVLRDYKLTRLRTGIAVSTLNREFGFMKAMFEEALERDWMSKNPFNSRRIKLIDTNLPPAGNKKMTSRKAARLLARSRRSANPLLHYLILTARYTGARPSELFPFHKIAGDDVLREPLCWKNIIDFDFKKLVLISYKWHIRTVREVPICERLEKGLRELYAKTPNAKPNDLLFPFASIKTSWRKLCLKCRITDVVFRDFRSFFNMELQDNPRIDEATRMQIMGHSTVTMNKHYITHLSDAVLETYRTTTLTPYQVNQRMALASSAVM